MHHVPEDQQVMYATFHLIGTAQLWYIHMTKDAPMSEYELFKRNLIRDFGPPICRMRSVTTHLPSTLAP